MIVRRNVGKKKKPPKPDEKDEVVRLLEDMNLTLNEILELLRKELEEDEPEPKRQQSTVGGPP